MNLPTSYKHTDAFRIMRYRSHQTGEPRSIWNSRDGRTPRFVRAPDGELLEHDSAHTAICDPKYAPDMGELVFVNLTLERAREMARERLSVLWTGEPFVHLDERERVAAVERSALDAYGDGGDPALVVWAIASERLSRTPAESNY